MFVLQWLGGAITAHGKEINLYLYYWRFGQGGVTGHVSSFT